MSNPMNRYAPPTAMVADVADASSEAERIRQEHIKHETSIKSIGTLYYLGGIGATVLALTIFIGSTQAPSVNAGVIVIVMMTVVISAISFYLGYAVRKLQPSAQIMAGIFCGFGLLAFPVGTLINGYALYLLFSQKGQRIFQPDYADIVAATPHIKYRTSIIVWIFLGIVILGIIAAIANPLIQNR